MFFLQLGPQLGLQLGGATLMELREAQFRARKVARLSQRL
jgi:hypothetical protein